MPKRPISKLGLFVLASVAIHVTIVLILKIKSSSGAPQVHGIVDVDYIQSAVHEKAPVSAAKREAKSKPVEQPKQDAAAPTPVAPPASAQTTGTPGDPQAAARASDLFLQSVSRLIDANKIYPKSSLRREEQGKVVVGVTINRDGSIADAQIEQACPFESLNQAALQTVRSVRIPPLPPEISAPLHLHVPLLYRLERN